MVFSITVETSHIGTSPLQRGFPLSEVQMHVAVKEIDFWDIMNALHHECP